MADKKILILSYHFPPLNVIASYRAKAYADFLKENGFYPTIVTHNWENIKSDKIAFEKNESYEVYKIPLIKNFNSQLGEFLEKKLKPFHLLYILLNWLIGNFDLSENYLNSYYSYESFLKSHLKDNKYDVAMAIYSPFYHLKSLYKVQNKFKLPIIGDFRDLHDNRVLDPEFNPSSKDKFRISLTTLYLKKWLKKALFISSVSPVWTDHLSKIIGVKGFTVLNGFETESFENFNFTSEKNEVFEITSIGTLYNNQDWPTYYQAINKFLIDKDPSCIKINFIGIREGYRKNLKEEILNNIPKNFLNLKGRVPKEDTIRYLINSQALLFPIPTGIKGYYTGKIFEYIASGTPIVSYPDDGDVLSQLLKKTNRDVLNSENAIVDYLNDLYKQWLHDKKSSNKPDFNSTIMQYSRKSQVLKFSNHLKEYSL